MTALVCHLADPGGGADPEAQASHLAAAVEVAREIIAAHGGHVGEVIGGRVASLFGLLEAHADDPVRAACAAVELGERLRGLQPPPRLRVGVATGEVLVRETGRDRSLLSADPLDTADRLARVARAGEILASPTTSRLAQPAVEMEPTRLIALPDDAEPVSAFRVVGAPPAGRPRPRRRSPLVGRHGDLAVLRQAAERATRQGTASLVTVLGPAGIGKSRLVEEFVEELRARARVLVGHCPPHGRDITFWPVIEVVRAAIDLHPGASPSEASERIARLLSTVGEPESDFVAEHILAVLGLAELRTATEDIAWALRRFLAAVASGDLCVVVLEDLHWAEATLLDVIEHLAASARHTPLLLVGTARPELVERRPTWGAGRLDATNLALGPLGPEESDELVRNLLGRGDLAPDVRTRITEAAEGNPLFLEELLDMLVEEQLIRWDAGRWTAAGDLRETPIPLTVQALLESRLDRLSASERAVLERAAIVGRTFTESDLGVFATEEPTRAHLESLTRRDLIVLERVGRSDRRFRFRHNLIREAVYRSTLKRIRAQAHASFGASLEERAADGTGEFDEVIGYHLEAALRYRRELGLAGEEDRALEARAVERLAAAGRRAFSREAMPAAASLLDRALWLIPAKDPRVPELSWRPAVALLEMGRFDAAQAELDRRPQQARGVGGGGHDGVGRHDVASDHGARHGREERGLEDRATHPQARDDEEEVPHRRVGNDQERADGRGPGDIGGHHEPAPREAVGERTRDGQADQGAQAHLGRDEQPHRPGEVPALFSAGKERGDRQRVRPVPDPRHGLRAPEATGPPGPQRPRVSPQRAADGAARSGAVRSSPAQLTFHFRGLPGRRTSCLRTIATSFRSHRSPGTAVAHRPRPDPRSRR